MPIVQWRFDDGGARRACQQLRRDVNREARRIAKHVAEERCVPVARRYAPTLYSGRVRAGATNRAAKVYIGGGVTQKRIAGWIEFGGTIRTLNEPHLVFMVGGRWVRVKASNRKRVPTGRYVGRAMRSHTMIRAATTEIRDEVNAMLRRRLTPHGVRVTAG